MSLHLLCSAYPSIYLSIYLYSIYLSRTSNHVYMYIYIYIYIYIYYIYIYILYKLNILMYMPCLLYFYTFFKRINIFLLGFYFVLFSCVTAKFGERNTLLKYFYVFWGTFFKQTFHINWAHQLTTTIIVIRINF